ncbi:MAG: hypothetical protein MUP27_09145 [Desulfobacterales bacterium]|nr:hypothetical protein [Desulfobacterales bacterium]
MRCPNCEKMVSYGDPEMEVQSEDVDESGNVEATVRLALTCADCGEELKDNEFELSTQVEHECSKEKLKEVKEEDQGEGFELELDEPESTEDYKPKTNKQGKPVPMRYQKHFFGVKLTGKVTCNKCKEEIPIEMEDECQASGFNECV